MSNSPSYEEVQEFCLAIVTREMAIIELLIKKGVFTINELDEAIARGTSETDQLWEEEKRRRIYESIKEAMGGE